MIVEKFALFKRLSSETRKILINLYHSVQFIKSDLPLKLLKTAKERRNDARRLAHTSHGAHDMRYAI